MACGIDKVIVHRAKVSPRGYKAIFRTDPQIHMLDKLTSRDILFRHVGNILGKDDSKPTSAAQPLIVSMRTNT